MKHLIENIPSRADVGKFFEPEEIGVELGVDEGDNAANLLEFGKPRKLFLVDFWTENAKRPGFEQWAEKKKKVEARFFNEIVGGRVVICDEDFATFLEKFPDGYFGWGYLDGWHGYHHVTRDLSKLLPKIKRGGIAAGHDFKVEPKDWGTGCPRAVLELIQNGVGPLIGLSNEENSDWVIRKGGFSL